MQQVKFQIARIIEHSMFNYRDVVFEVDPVFSLIVVQRLALSSFFSEFNNGYCQPDQKLM